MITPQPQGFLVSCLGRFPYTDPFVARAGAQQPRGDYKGPEAVLGFLEQLKALSDGTFRIEVLDVLSEPERAVVLQRETATRNDKALDVVVAVDFEIHHGKITEVTVYQADTYQFDEFWEDS